MQIRNSPDRFGLPAQALHWLTALCMLGAWLLGTTTDSFPRGEPRAQALALHWSLGLLVLGFALARLALRATDTQPREPTTMARWEVIAAKAAHVLLYALMVALPLSGLATAFFQGRTVSVFGLFTVPALFERDRALGRSVKEIHELFANGMLVVAGLHALAALRHHFMLRDDVLRRMLPWTSGQRG